MWKIPSYRKWRDSDIAELESEMTTMPAETSFSSTELAESELHAKDGGSWIVAATTAPSNCPLCALRLLLSEPEGLHQV